MGKVAISLLLTSLFLGSVVFPHHTSGSPNVNGNSSYQGKTWCVVKIGVPNDRLQAYISSTCGRYDCKPIQPGGSCYNPNTLQNHASYLLDVVFRSENRCDPELGLPAVTDPSFGSCHYP